MPDVLTKSNLYRKVSGKLITPYNVMTTFFFRRSVEKAFQLDEYPTGLSLNPNKSLEGNAPYIMLSVDDVMYIVNNVVQKSISTSQRDVIVSVIPTIQRVLTGDFIGMIQRKMRDESYPKAIVQGGFPPEDKIIQFVVLINSLDMSNEYLTRIIRGRIGVSSDQTNGAIHEGPLNDAFCFDRDVALAAKTLHALETSFLAKSMELLNEGLEHLFKMVIRARLRPVLGETFRDADYRLTEEVLAEIGQQDDEGEEDIMERVPRRFEHGWDQLMKPLARIMTPGTFGALLNMTARHLSKVLEGRLLSYVGKTNPFGVIRIERDFTSIMSTVSRGDYTVRDAFGKVTQLLMVANMEEDEWDEMMAQEDGDGIKWLLTDEEKRRARSLVQG